MATRQERERERERESETREENKQNAHETAEGTDNPHVMNKPHSSSPSTHTHTRTQCTPLLRVHCSYWLPAPGCTAYPRCFAGGVVLAIGLRTTGTNTPSHNANAKTTDGGQENTQTHKAEEIDVDEDKDTTDKTPNYSRIYG